MVTGGYYTGAQLSRQTVSAMSDRVVSYSARGEATLLPSLQTPRSSHACGYYYTNGQVVRKGDSVSITYPTFFQRKFILDILGYWW